MFNSEDALNEIKFLDRKEAIVHQWNSLKLTVPPTVYPPREDTQLLYDVLKSLKPFGSNRLLEIGSGSGALALSAAKRGWSVDACDVNPYAVAATRLNAREAQLELHVIEGGVGPEHENWKNDGLSFGAYDMVIWNMPYIPANEVKEQHLGPMEEAALIDTHPEGLLSVFAKRMASNRMCKLDGIALLVCRGHVGWKRSVDVLRQHGLAARIVSSETFDDQETIYVIATWMPFVSSKHHIMAEIDSTNKEMLRGSYNVGDSLMARRQTDGRGRHGNDWEDHPGAFKCSWLLDPKFLTEINPLRQLQVAQEVHAVFQLKENHANQTIVKWPNDLLIRAQQEEKWRKYGGLLFQSYSKGKTQKLVLGVGINTQMEILSPGQGALEEIGIRHTSTELFPILSAVVASIFEEKHPSLRRHFDETYTSKFLLNSCIYRGESYTVIDVLPNALVLQNRVGVNVTVEDDEHIEWVNLHPQ